MGALLGEVIVEQEGEELLDLNAVPQEPAIDLLRTAGFRSAEETVHGRYDPTFPSGLVAPSIYRGPGFTIDYVWVRGAALLVDSSITLDRPSVTDPTLYPSDHRGVSADLVVARSGMPSRP